MLVLPRCSNTELPIYRWPNEKCGCPCIECFLLRSLPINTFLLLTCQGFHSYINLPTVSTSSHWHHDDFLAKNIGNKYFVIKTIKMANLSGLKAYKTLSLLPVKERRSTLPHITFISARESSIICLLTWFSCEPL